MKREKKRGGGETSAVERCGDTRMISVGVTTEGKTVGSLNHLYCPSLPLSPHTSLPSPPPLPHPPHLTPYSSSHPSPPTPHSLFFPHPPALHSLTPHTSLPTPHTPCGNCDITNGAIIYSVARYIYIFIYIYKW